MTLTTRRRAVLPKRELLFVLLDVSDSVANSSDILYLIIEKDDVESLLELHDELYCVERVGTQVVCEACFRLYVLLVYTQLFSNNFLYFRFAF